MTSYFFTYTIFYALFISLLSRLNIQSIITKINFKRVQFSYLSKSELSSQSADVVLNYNFAQNTPYLVKNFPQPHVAYYIEQVIK